MLSKTKQRGKSTSNRYSVEEYKRRDIPIKCRVCRFWMRSVPRYFKLDKKGNPSAALKRLYVERAQEPNASYCVDCLLNGGGREGLHLC